MPSKWKKPFSIDPSKGVGRTRCRAWANPAFAECYKSVALAVIRNADAIKSSMHSGGLSPQEAVYQKPHEMRPDLWRPLVDKKRAREASYGEKPTANTNLYRCHKCKSQECYFYELQTRSGDEPMTIFLTCLNCGNRWRMEG